MSNLWPSIVRTFTPQIAGVLVAWLVQLGVEIPEGVAQAIVVEAFAVVYYVVVRVLEQVRSSKWGWLLGAPKAPHYFTPG